MSVGDLLRCGQRKGNGLRLLNATRASQLHLGSNALGDEGMQYLAEGLEGLSMLQSLNLKNNMLGPASGTWSSLILKTANRNPQVRLPILTYRAG